MLSDVQIEVCAMGRSFVQWSPTECVYVSLSVVRCNTHTLQQRRIRRNDQRKKKERKKEKRKKKLRGCTEIEKK
jgi:hypothetical protein